jgi:hypothetical protein
VFRVLVYGSETWDTKVEDVCKPERIKTAVVRWMCGVKLKDKRISQELLNRLVLKMLSGGVEDWYGLGTLNTRCGRLAEDVLIHVFGCGR